MGRSVVWQAVFASLMAGCSCEGGGTDGGIARDAAPPCEGPIRLQRYTLSPAFGEYRSAQLSWVADLPDRSLGSFMVSRDGIDPYFGTPTLVAEDLFAVTRGEVWSPIDGPDGGSPIDLGDQILFSHDGRDQFYSATGWVERDSTVVPEWDNVQLVSCDAARTIGIVQRSTADGVSYGVALIDFSGGSGRLLSVTPLDSGTGAPTVLACAVDDGTLYAVVQAYVESYAPSFMLEGRSPPLVVRVTPENAVIIRALDAQPIAAAALQGHELMALVGQPAVSGLVPEVWDLETWSRVGEGPMVRRFTQGTGSSLVIDRGALFVFRGDTLFGLLWDGRTVSDAWEMAIDGQLSTGGTWWSNDYHPSDLRPAAIRYCEGG